MQRQLKRVRAVELVQPDAINGFDPLGQRPGRAEKHRFKGAPRAAQARFQVLAADDALFDHLEAVEESGLRKSLAPHAFGNGTGEIERKLVRLDGAVCLDLQLEVARSEERAHRSLESV